MTFAKKAAQLAEAKLQAQLAEDAVARAEEEADALREEVDKLLSDEVRKKARGEMVADARDWLDRQALLGMSREHQAVVERLIEDLR